MNLIRTELDSRYIADKIKFRVFVKNESLRFLILYSNFVIQYHFKAINLIVKFLWTFNFLKKRDWISVKS